VRQNLWGNEKCYFITLLWREQTSPGNPGRRNNKQKEKQETQSCNMGHIVANAHILINIKNDKQKYCSSE